MIKSRLNNTMKTKLTLNLICFCLLPSTFCLSGLAQGTTFTYQGRLTGDGAPAVGRYDLTFTLFDAATRGSVVGTSNEVRSIEVSNGLFTVELDFGSKAFTGADRWLEIALRPASSPDDYVALSPRQPITTTPYAITASKLSGPLPASQLTGTLPSARLNGIYSGALTFSNAANTLAGNGAALTGLNAAALASGTIPDARLAANVARTDQVWLQTGNAGINAATEFLGTTDAAPLVLRAGNRQVLRLEGQSSGVRLLGGVNPSLSTSSTNSAILGGRDGVIEARAHESTIGGGLDNIIRADQRSAFIGGGAHNEILADNQHAVIVGGRDNRIGTNVVISLVVGGGENRIANNVDGGLMVGGFRNDILGSLNPNRREIAPILLGGSDNEIGRDSSWTVILGGDNNRIGTNCASAVIAGGTNNLVADNCGLSFAAGRRCRVNHAGAFVWADSQNASFASAGEDTFNIRSQGGMHLSGDTSQFFGSSTRQMLNLWSTRYGLGVQASTLYFRTDNGFAWYQDGIHSDTQNSPGTGGTERMRLDSSGLRVNGTFVSASDRNAKGGFTTVDPQEILAKVATLPITRWHYTNDAATPHVGPVAQDFHAAFGVGPDDQHIATVDADGVALAAIQGLNQRVEAGQQRAEAQSRQSEDRIWKLEAENAALKSRLERLEQLLELNTR